MRTLAEVKSALEKLENGAELYEVVSNSILTAKNDRKTEFYELKNNHDKLFSVVKSLGYNPESGDVESFANGLKTALESGNENTKRLTSEQKRLQDLEKEMAKLNQSLTMESEKRRKSEEAVKYATLKDVLLPKLKGKIYSAETHAKQLIREGLVDAEGEDLKSVFFKNGQEKIDIEKGLQIYFDNHKDDLINTQKPGSESTPSNGSSQDKTMPMAAFNALSPLQRMEYIKGGGKPVD